MQRFWYYIYNGIAIPVFWIVFHSGSLFNRKIRRGIRGRSGLFERLEKDVTGLKRKKRIWFHSSSLGEFEQAKPIIAALRKKFSNLDIIVTFFSPSGYEHSRNYKLADLITYIPFDTAANAQRFLDLIRPDVAVMVRYDVWPNHVWELSRRKVPSFIANATLRANSARLWWPLKSFHRTVYQSLTSILTVSNEDAESFRRFNLKGTEIRVVGESRYDQVWQRSEEAKRKHPIPPSLLRRKSVFVVGSSWEEDEEVVLPAFRKMHRQDSGALMILVPHEPTVETIERLEVQLAYLGLRTIRFSDLNDFSNEQVIVVDSVGVLMALYQYANVAFVGGSFKQGIHNVLEPAVYGVPVMYGPQHENSREAIQLAGRGGGIVVHDQAECHTILHEMLTNPKRRMKAGAIAFGLVKENVGATKRFIEYLSPILDGHHKS
jgi:3-deoxy-D-manno-octulosonic-acid transferase